MEANRKHTRIHDPDTSGSFTQRLLMRTPTNERNQHNLALLRHRQTRPAISIWQALQTHSASLLETVATHENRRKKRARWLPPEHATTSRLTDHLTWKPTDC